VRPLSFDIVSYIKLITQQQPHPQRGTNLSGIGVLLLAPLPLSPLSLSLAGLCVVIGRVACAPSGAFPFPSDRLRPGEIALLLPACGVGGILEGTGEGPGSTRPPGWKTVVRFSEPPPRRPASLLLGGYALL
jgi:hypothetical protein